MGAFTDLLQAKKTGDERGAFTDLLETEGGQGAFTDLLPTPEAEAEQPVQPVGPRPVAGPEFTERGLAGVMQTDPRVKMYQSTDAERATAVLKGAKEIGAGFIERPHKFAPITGSVIDAIQSADVIAAAKRLETNDYKERPAFTAAPTQKRATYVPFASAQFEGRETYEGLPENWTPELQRRHDSKLLDDWRNEMTRLRDTGKWTYQVGRIVGEMPAFMVEYLLTGGLVGAGKGVAKEAAEKLTKREVAKRLGAWAGRGVVRGTAMPQRTAAEYFRRRLPEQVRETPDGELEFVWPKDKPFTSFLKAYGDTVIEAASESAGEELAPMVKRFAGAALAKLPFGEKVLDRLYAGWAKLHPESTWDDFLTAISTRAGYHGLLAEVGEEYLGDSLRGITGVEDFGAGAEAGPLERAWAAFQQDVRQTPVMIASFSVPGMVKGGVGMVGREIVPEPGRHIPYEGEEVERPREPITLDQLKERMGLPELPPANRPLAKLQAAEDLLKAGGRTGLVNEHIRLYRQWQQMEPGAQQDEVGEQIYDMIRLINGVDRVADPDRGRGFVPPEMEAYERYRIEREAEAQRAAGPESRKPRRRAEAQPWVEVPPRPRGTAVTRHPTPPAPPIAGEEIPERQRPGQPARPEGLAEETPGRLNPAQAFDAYRENMPNATELEVVHALIEDGQRVRRDLREKYADDPWVREREADYGIERQARTYGRERRRGEQFKAAQAAEAVEKAPGKPPAGQTAEKPIEHPFAQGRTHRELAEMDLKEYADTIHNPAYDRYQEIKARQKELRAEGGDYATSEEWQRLKEEENQIVQVTGVAQVGGPSQQPAVGQASHKRIAAAQVQPQPAAEGKQPTRTHWDYRMWGKGTAARMIDDEGRPVRRIRATLEGKTVLCENPKHARGIYRNGGIAIKPDGSRWAGEPAERAEPDVEKQEEDARYRAELARTTRFIREHPLYQAAVQGREDQAFTRTGGLRMIYVPEAMASDVESYAGQDRRKGLWRYITHDAKAAQHYDDWASELGLEGTLDAAMTRLQQLYEAEREMGKGAISESVFEEAVRQANDVELEVVAMKRNMLRAGEPFDTINTAIADYVRDFAEFGGQDLPAEAQADIIETHQIKGKANEAQRRRVRRGEARPPDRQAVPGEAAPDQAGAEAQATPPEGQRREGVTPEEPAPPAPVTKADTGVFGQTIFRSATGTKQGELGLEFAPKGKEAVPIKPELAKAVAAKAGKAKDAKSLYLDAFTDKSDLFQNPDNPMPEMQEAWDQATKGRPLPAAETTPEAKPPERPLVNPHASALKRDAQLRRQQAWDKKYGQAGDKGRQAKGETPPSDPTLGRPSAMGGFAGGRPGAARANVSAIVAEKMDTGSKSGNDFLKRTKGYTRQTRPGPLRNTARHLARFARNFRFLPEIPRTRQFAEVREAFRHILAIPKLAYTHSVDDMRWALKAVEGTATEARKRIQAVELKLIADDLMEDVESGVELPRDMTRADVAAMKTEGDRLYEKYPTVREALDRIREANQKVTDMLVAEGWLAPERAREFYFPHKVIRYLRSNDAFFGIGRKPAEPRKGYLRQRKGGSDYSTDVLERLIEHWAEVRRDVETSRFLEKAFKQEHGAFRKLNPNWKPGDALPAEYKEVTILPGRFYYRTNGVTEDLAMALLNRDLAAIEAVLEEQGLKAMAPVREMLALGRRRAYVVRREIAQQVLDMPTAPISDQPLYKAARSFNTFVKRQILFNPLYAIPFHVTNFIGDYHRMIIALPSASEPKYIAGYWKAVLAAHKGERPALLGEAQQYDVIGSGWLGVDVKKLESIIPELERAEISGAAAVAANRAKRLFNTVRAVGQGREDWLRYATFMRLCDLQDAGKDITKLSVKDVEVVRGLTGHVQAAKIARDIMLDYAAIGKSAQMMSEVVSPFYRWMHLNIPWWPRMAAAYAKRGQAGRLAWAIMTAFAPYILAHLWNTSDDERRKLEEKLPPWRRYNFHIIAKGKVWYVPLPTDDLANFLGVPESAADFKAYQKGLIDVRELICRIAGNGLYNPVLGVINSVGGAGGVLRDTMGIQTFPDIADYRITSWQRRALNVAKTIFGAPAQLAEAAKRGDAAKVHDLLWRSVLPVRGWTPTAEPLDILAAHTYREDQERSGNPLEWRAHKGEEKAVSRLKAQIAEMEPEEIRQWRSEYERQRRREAMERKRERIRALRAERPKEK